MAYSSARRMIEHRRKTEEAYRDYDSVIAANKRQLQIANFEIQTCIKIDKRRERVGILFDSEISRFKVLI
jgi:hypothetical protein